MIDKALQYSPSFGVDEFRELLKKFQIDEHNPSLPADKWDICVTTGSQDGISKSMDMLVDEGDYVLVEDPTYAGALMALKPLNANLTAIPSDGEGLIPSELDKILQNWPTERKKPKVLYTIPVGQNPSGATISLSRKVEIYKLAQKHNLIIIEDDPYWNLRFEGEELKSFFSMDTDGRVLRLDSLSKVVSSGFRIGWVTGPKFLVERIQIDQQSNELHSSGISQVAAYTLLSKWGREGWLTHVAKIKEFYRNRRDMCIKYAKQHLTGIATWNTPSAGMFLWIKLNGVKDTKELIQKKAVEKKVILLPGTAFTVDNSPSSYIRCSYSLATETEMDIGLQRLAEILHEHNN